jgi:hypothetical protein
MAACLVACGGDDTPLDEFVRDALDGSSVPDVVADTTIDAPADVRADVAKDAPNDTTTDVQDAGSDAHDASVGDADAGDAPVDAPTDAPNDSPADAPIDSPADAPIDSPADAPIDSPADSPADAPVDSPPDAPDAADAGCNPPIGSFTAGASTLAGCNIAGATDGTRDVARFANPVNVAIAPTGDIYVADYDNDRIRVVTSGGTARTLTHQTGFSRPFGLVFTDMGKLYVTTDRNATGQGGQMAGTVWTIDLNTGVATVVAHDIGRPRGMVALSSPDTRIVVSDYVHHVVQFVDTTNGTVTPLAGTFDQSGWVDAMGTAARFNVPYGLAMMADGRIAVADYANNRIRAIALDGTVTTLAGSGAQGVNNGPAATATFNLPQDVAIDATGNVFVSDVGNYVVRKIASGQVSTVAGSGVAGFLDDDNPLVAMFFGMEGLDVTSDGQTLYIADGDRGNMLGLYNRVRVVLLP